MVADGVANLPASAARDVTKTFDPLHAGLDGGVVLHVAALHLGARQGTQVYVEALVAAARAQGIDARVLTYRTAAQRCGPSVCHARPTRLRPGLRPRSGLTWRKPALDLALAWRVRRVAGHLRPQRVIAHHVEALLACRLAGLRGVHFVRHTDLAEELPTYLGAAPAVVKKAAAWSGALVDACACSLADFVAGVSPALAAPQTLAPPPLGNMASTLPSKAEARRRLGLPVNPATGKAPSSPNARTGNRLLGYIGNLDDYQGWWRAVECLSYQPNVQLLLVTDSPTRACLEYATLLGIAERVHFRPLRHPARRTLAYAAVDMVVVPREAGRGVPVKLIDAAAHGVPVIAEPRALAGFPPPAGVYVARGHSARALAQACHALDATRQGLEGRSLGEDLGLEPGMGFVLPTERDSTPAVPGHQEHDEHGPAAIISRVNGPGPAL